MLIEDDATLFSEIKERLAQWPGERYDLLITFDQDGSYPFHSHNIIDNTNNGIYPGGMHTMVQVTKDGKTPAGTHHHQHTEPIPEEIREGTTVVISDMRYSIPELKVKKGTTVTWINNDPMFHTVTSIDDKFDSRHIEPGKQYSYTFQEKGTFPYYCATHPSMEASVIVE